MGSVYWCTDFSEHWASDSRWQCEMGNLSLGSDFLEISPEKIMPFFFFFFLLLFLNLEALNWVCRQSFVWKPRSHPGRHWQLTGEAAQGLCLKWGCSPAQKQGGKYVCTVYCHQAKPTATQRSWQVCTPPWRNQQPSPSPFSEIHAV